MASLVEKVLGLLAVAVLLLAGCAGTASPPLQGPTAASPASATSATAQLQSAPTQASTTSKSPSASAAPDSSSIHGVVVDSAIRPLAANVTLLERHQVQATTGGAFRFDGLATGVYTLQVRASGYRAQDLVVETSSDQVRVVLEALPGAVPYNVTMQFHGTFECALEVLIISPSCDTAVTFVQPGFHQFNTTSVVTIPVDQAWRTVVTDVVFDASGQPLLDGLRVTVQGTHDTSQLGTYQQYGRFNGKQSFTFSLAPDGTYADTTAGPVPANTTAFRFEVFPQSLAWHAICAPPGSSTCFLGVGAGQNVEFDLYITTFYGTPAPDGFSFL